MPAYLYNYGTNLQPCTINAILLHELGIDVNLETELEDDKGVTLTETAGTRVIPQLAGRKSLTKFTLSFRYGVEPSNFVGLAKPQIEKFNKQRETLTGLYLLNEPLSIDFKDLSDFGVKKMFMLSRTVNPYELYEEVYINCVEYSEAHYKSQSEKTAKDWYVNKVDDANLQSRMEQELKLLAGA